MLFIITSNDGWCQDTYCNADPELDDKFVGFLEQLQKNALAQVPLKNSGAGLSKARDGRFVIENRCRDVEQRGDDVIYEHCSIGKSPLSKEECEYRGCCCVNYDTDNGNDADEPGDSHGRCDQCVVERSSNFILGELKQRAAERSARYMVRGLSQYPHFVVLGSNALVSQAESQNLWVKLLERMLIQSVMQDDLPPLVKNLMNSLKQSDIEVRMTLNFDRNF